MPKQKPRDTIRYNLRQGRKIVHKGITKRPLEERLAEHQTKYPGATISKVGPKVTEDTARKWERDQPNQKLVRKSPSTRVRRSTPQPKAPPRRKTTQSR